MADSKVKCERIYAGSFACEERDGYIWALMKNLEGRPMRLTSGRLTRCAGTADVQRALQDRPSDGGTALQRRSRHHRADGSGARAFRASGVVVATRRSIREKAKQFEPIPNGFRMSPHAPSANSAPYKLLKWITGEPATTTIDFVLPNQRFEQIRAGRYWLSSRTTVTPVRRDLCRLDFVAAWNILPWFPVVRFIIEVLGPRFIRQDTEVIEKQSLGLQYEDRMMLVDDADRQARWYFELKAARLESQRTGEPCAIR